MSPETTPPQSINKWFTADTQFDRIYPVYTQLLSRRHWTPLHVAKIASHYLAPHRGYRVLDIGSGVGKFCLAGAYFTPYASFYGVEQRQDLLDVAEDAKALLGLRNAHFLLQNFAGVDFSAYNSFYFFNSFYENLPGNERIDNNMPFSEKIYHQYSSCLFEKLDDLPVGARLATYHTFEGQVPPSFALLEEQSIGLLKCWKKFR